jgi:hypothetical protein
MNPKVLRVLEIYAEGGGIMDAFKEAHITSRDFYKEKRTNPTISALYDDIKRDRGDMASEEAYGVVRELDTGLITDEKHARVKAEILLKIAAMYDPNKFGNRVNVQADVGPNIIGAMSDAAKRLAPGRDLIPAIDAEYAVIVPKAADFLSDASAAPDDDDPFVD